MFKPGNRDGELETAYTEGYLQGVREGQEGIENILYPHRNGVSHIPEIPGYYFIVDDRGRTGMLAGCRMEYISRWSIKHWQEPHQPHLKYYGPIPEPEGFVK
jgi:hypothetical protein